MTTALWTLTDLSARYEVERADFLSRVGQAQALTASLERLTAEVDAHEVLARTHEAVALLFQSYSEHEHEQLRERIEQLVTFGLQSVFGETLSFRVRQGSRNGQASVEFFVVSEDEAGEIETDVLEARGGGLAAIIGFILRVVVLSLGPTSQRRFLLLDETLGMLSAEYHEPMSLLLRRLVDEAGLQVLLVTHAPKQAIYADTIYRFDHDGQRTVYEAISKDSL